MGTGVGGVEPGRERVGGVRGGSESKQSRDIRIRVRDREKEKVNESRR